MKPIEVATSHNPVPFRVLIPRLVRQVFQTLGDLAVQDPGTDPQLITAVSSTHRFRDRYTGVEWTVGGHVGRDVAREVEWLECGRLTLFRDNVQFCSGLTIEAAVTKLTAGWPELATPR